MAKWFGTIGYEETVETAPGVWEEKIVVRSYYGDLLRNTRRLQSTDQLNDNINVANEISILADPYAMEHFHSIRYVEFSGSLWKVNNVEVNYPRLSLSLGGMYTNV
jgi:hypothetical protein